MEKDEQDEIPIGIDFGTSNSCGCIIMNDKVYSTKIDLGTLTIPSFVTFTENERLFGLEAKNTAISNVGNAVFDVKRLIGRNYDDEIIQEYLKLWPFKVQRGENNRPLIKVTWRSETKQFYPEEISAMIIEQIKNNIETTFNVKVKSAVITVPAYFNDAQRNSIKAAGEIAGLNVMRILNEPTAAAIAYSEVQRINDPNFNPYKPRIILIYDLGGGTFDVSIVKIEYDKCTVLAKGGDPNLGGRDFDNNMFNYFATCFKNNHHLDIMSEERSKYILMGECESAKINLSVHNEATIKFNSKVGLIEDKITREKFEDLNNELFDRTIITVGETIASASLNKTEIDDIVLTGGSSRIPLLKEKLHGYFGKEPCRNIDPEIAVAYGAAINASPLDGIEVVDVTPLSLGVRITHDKTDFIIPRNTIIPCTYHKRYTTNHDYQHKFSIYVLEGERQNQKYNNLLGKFTLKNIRRAPKGEVEVEITFDLDINQILKVTVREISTNNVEVYSISNEEGRLTDEQIMKMLNDAEKYREIDRMFEEKINAINDFQNKLYEMRRRINKLYQENSKEEIDSLKKYIERLIHWLSNNEKNVDIKELERKRNEFEQSIEPYENN
ncbi:cytoplasmic heat shock protein 70 [Histomonas meleagridis]|uniref:cytoplasmic heat shock protein 70 n=1 Tax=Histomonas meleagridis TaxID=135588 RepID=UPI00355A4C87|nr:cytoplasmic heat shock protein 70 [Histomonas meleagridis]KAH0803695.1 cytoplasmic heat shock protein 70 [Histomonas meleagridis]